MPLLAVFDAKSYDREYLGKACEGTGLRLVFHEFRLCEKTADIAAGADAVCAFVNDRIDRACLEKLARIGVRHVAMRCAGYNRVDLSAAASLGITVTRVPAYSPYAVAEHTVALLLTLTRHIHRAHNRVREQNFSLGGLIGFDLHGKTVGLVGTGKIGRVAARIFTGFGMRVIAHDKSPDAAWAESAGVSYVDFENLLAESDIVSLHLPLTPDSHHLIDDAALARMKTGATLLNTSRGALIDAKALIAALKSGHIGGAALDVYEEEEGVFFEDHSGEILDDDTLARLTTFPNVLITAHQAFLTREALEAIAVMTRDNSLLVSDGQAPMVGTRVGE
jgi:D-lactate dehydrogenase